MYKAANRNSTTLQGSVAGARGFADSHDETQMTVSVKTAPAVPAPKRLHKHHCVADEGGPAALETLMVVAR